MKQLRVEKGRLLAWRLGDLNFGPQDRWSRAPESKGMWAFPWPYFEIFFAYHKFKDALPKRLQEQAYGLPADPSWIRNPEGLPLAPGESFIHEDGYLATGYTVDPQYGIERDEWIRTVGTKQVPLRKFWIEGEIYTHFKPGAGVLPLDEWHLLTPKELQREIIRERGDRYFERGPNGFRQGGTYSKDHFEIFLSPKHARVVGQGERGTYHIAQPGKGKYDS